MTAQRLLGKKCIVTGGSSGIGLAIGRRFAVEGAREIILVARNQDRLNQLKATHEGDGLNGFVYRAGDVTNQEWWEGQKKEMQDVDVLANVAGISQTGHLVRTPTDQVDRILRTNLTGTILGCKAMARAMLGPRKDGHEACIINVSSLLGVRGGHGATVYAASKAGVLGLTRSLVAEMAEFKHVLRVNVIVPGYIDTPMLEGFPSPARAHMSSQIPLKRFGTPEEIADAAVFLASNQYANNCVLNLDGGLSAS